MSAHNGVLVANRYRLVDRIADGGMSTVWEAWDERLHRRVALKQLRVQTGLSESDARLAAERAMREGRITARLHHPHAVPVYDVVDHEGSPCLVMQYLASRSLQAVLTDRGTLDVAEAARIGAEIAAALAAAHKAGIVHRDVKPGNVLIAEDGSAKLTDFGISHALGDVTLTSTGMVTGTPAYLSPEVARGEPAGFPSDVFSLGATLFTVLEGTPPVGDSDNPIAVLHRVASGQLNTGRRRTPMTSLLNRMLALDPAARPPMAAVADELAAIARKSAEPATARTTARLAALPAQAASPPPPSTTVILPPAHAEGSVADAPPSRRPPVVPGHLPLRRRRPGWAPVVALAVVVGALVVTAVVLLIVVIGRKNGSPTGSAQQRTTTSPPPSHSSSQRTSQSRSSAAGGGNGDAPNTGHSTRSSSESSSTTGTDTRLNQTITNYYALLPDNTNDAWPQLTTSYQVNHAGGRTGYEHFWSQFRNVTTSNVHSVGQSTVEATITYTYDGGKQTTEVTDFELVDENGTLKINQSDVVG